MTEGETAMPEESLKSTRTPTELLILSFFVAHY